MMHPSHDWSMDTRHVGRRVLFFDTLPSTNTFAKHCEAGTVIVAAHQTAGRGQYERVWQSQPGCALLMSAVVPAITRPSVLIAWAAVAVAETIRTLTGQAPALKWPNDVLISGKKVCGILTETHTHAIVGIGLNLAQTAADFEGLPDATSLALATDVMLDAASVLRPLLLALDAHFERILGHDLDALESDWRRLLNLTGRHVSVTLANEEMISGRLHALSFEALEIEAGDGVFTAIMPEHVRAIRL